MEFRRAGIEQTTFPKLAKAGLKQMFPAFFVALAAHFMRRGLLFAGLVFGFPVTYFAVIANYLSGIRHNGPSGVIRKAKAQPLRKRSHIS